MISSTLSKPIKVSTFTSYLLSNEDQLQGQIFSVLQEAVLQNMLVDLAEEKLNLKYDPEHPLIFLQREAELQGQIGLVSFIIELSTTGKNIVQDRVPKMQEMDTFD
jgi:hypothetical protein